MYVETRVSTSGLSKCRAEVYNSTRILFSSPQNSSSRARNTSRPVTGFAMMGVAGWPLSADWIRISLALYLLAGVCWLPVVVLQIRMARMTETAAERGTPLPRKYAEMALRWTLLGVPAFVAMIAITYLMVLKPS